MSLIFFDVETFKNFFSAQFVRDDGKRIALTMDPDQPLDIAKLRAVMFSGATFVGFNSLHYDMPMIAGALAGYDNAQLKALSDKIIGGNVKSWQHRDLRMPDVDHIDLYEPTPGVQIGLKLLAARLCAPTIQDLPFTPDENVTPDMQQTIIDYCFNDIECTRLLHSTLTDAIKLREDIGAMIGVDLRSKSDAQVGEAVVRAEVERLMGAKLPKPISRAGKVFAYNPPAWLSFTDPMLQRTLRDVCSANFTVKPDGAVALPDVMRKVIKFDGGAYRMGIGGLHSTEKRQHVAATADALLIDRDVRSFYPWLIVQNGLSPEATRGHFQAVYRSLLDRRMRAQDELKALKAAKSTDTVRMTALTLEIAIVKIALNGVFGKLGSRYSFLYAPELLIQVTVTGQLALLMFIERITAAGAHAVSANTDGVVFQCPVGRQDAVKAAIAEWERVTGLETEETRYSDLWSRDVNTYVARKLDGNFKLKGGVANTGVAALEAWRAGETGVYPDWTHNIDSEICIDAALAWLSDGAPIEYTIRSCRDIRKFVTVRRVTGGAVLDGAPVGKVVRWYAAVDRVAPMRYITSGNKVPGSDGAKPVMVLPEEFPSDVRYGHYIVETLKLLHEIGAT